MDQALTQQLERSRALGFLGPGPVEAHIAHAVGFLDALGGVSGRIIELGSGGGVPGLVVAVARPDLELILVEAVSKRCAFLEAAVVALGLVNTRLVAGRAEIVGRSALRGTADAVIARGFGSPSATAECAAPLLRIGGRLIVSEPPSDQDRWASERLALLGLLVGDRSATSPVMQVLIQADLCPDAYPRRDGRPAKRPLF